MKSNELKKKALAILGKYRYAALVAVIGIALLAIPAARREAADGNGQPEDRSAEQFRLTELEERLSGLLSKCEGVGRAEVMLTQESGMNSVYEKDVSSTRKNDTDGETEQSDEESRLSVVKSGSYGEEAVLVRTDYPQLRGALVVCEGADSASVRLSVTEAVMSLTGLSADRISVIKMQ